MTGVQTCALPICFPVTIDHVDAIAEKFIKAANSAGLFAIELFLDKNGKVWVNETAPRLHNSGHQTQEGNANSQFEQFYRTLKNLPLADTDAFGFSGMLNLVGEQNYSGKVKYEGLEEVLKLPKTYIHLYGKIETKPGRKMECRIFCLRSLFGRFRLGDYLLCVSICPKKGKSITNFNAELRKYDYRHFLRLADFR